MTWFLAAVTYKGLANVLQKALPKLLRFVFYEVALHAFARTYLVCVGYQDASKIKVDKLR